MNSETDKREYTADDFDREAREFEMTAAERRTGNPQIRESHNDRIASMLRYAAARVREVERLREANKWHNLFSKLLHDIAQERGIGDGLSARQVFDELTEAKADAERWRFVEQRAEIRSSASGRYTVIEISLPRNGSADDYGEVGSIVDAARGATEEEGTANVENMD